MPPFEVPAHRNLAGYGAHPPHPHWPDGARVAVSLVVNVEEGSEQAVSRGDAVNEHVYDMIDAIAGGPNLTMESHFDYGTRAGYWRIVRVLERYGATCTVNACAEALALSPCLGAGRGRPRLRDREPRLSLAQPARHERGRGAGMDSPRRQDHRRRLRRAPGRVAHALPAHAKHAAAARRGGRISLR
jgi:hypothetical protein